MNSNEKKSLKLGMSFNKARRHLMKSILFDLVKKLNLDICFRCGQKIEKIAELSVEHKKAWLNSENPKELFFDLDNIVYSHLKCNISVADHSYMQTKEWKEKTSIAFSGENTKSCKLSYEDVKIIRKRCLVGETSRSIAKDFNITHVHVLHIKNNKRRLRG